MANKDTVFGARIISTPRPEYTFHCIIPSTDNTAVYMGDFVTHQGTSALSADIGIYLPTVAQAAASQKLLGIVISFFPSRTYENQIYRTASTERIAIVTADPYVLFEIQSDGTGVVGDIGNNANIIVASGSTITGLSGMELQESSITTTATLPLRIVGVVPRADNDIGANVKYICMMNYCHFKDTTGQ